MPRFAALLAAFTLAFSTAAWAHAPYEDERTPEGWAWAKIRHDKIADFGELCGNLDPYANMDDPCRRISPQFMVDVLTVPKLRQEIARRHVRLRGVRVNGTIDLSDADITSEVRIDASRIEGSVILNGSHWDRFLSLEGSTVAGDFSATEMHTESDVLLRNGAAVQGEVILVGAKIGGNLLGRDG